MHARSALLGRHGKSLENPRAIQRVTTALKRYLIPFFGNYEISSITSKQAQAYLSWRKRYYIDGPGASVDKLEYDRGGRRLSRPLKKSPDPAHSTLNKDVVAFNKVLDYARGELEIDLPHAPRIRLKVSRHESPSTLLPAVARAVARHESQLEALERIEPVRLRYAKLTSRGREVFGLVAEGKMNKEIGRELGATERTIKAHRRRVMEKLEAGSFVELLSIARHLELGAK